MDLHELQAFVEVAKTGSFSAAAHALYLTQPAVSKRIAALEDSLGAALFDRIGRRVRLTEAGEALLPRARALLHDAAELKRLVSNLSGKVSGLLIMGTSHHIGLRRLPPVLRDYSRRYPDVRLDIRFLDSEAACRAVEQGELELAIVTLPAQPLPTLDTLLLWQDPLRVVVAADYPLRDGVSLKRLLQQPALLPEPTTYTRQLVDQALARKGLRAQVEMTTNYLETLKMLAAAGLGWSLLPATMLDASLRVLNVTGLHLSRRLGIVAHQARSMSNAGQAMIARCRAHASFH